MPAAVSAVRWCQPGAGGGDALHEQSDGREAEVTNRLADAKPTNRSGGDRGRLRDATRTRALSGKFFAVELHTFGDGFDIPRRGGAVFAAAGDLRGDIRYESRRGMIGTGNHPWLRWQAPVIGLPSKALGRLGAGPEKGEQLGDHLDGPHRSRVSMLIGAIIRALVRLFPQQAGGASQPTPGRRART